MGPPTKAYTITLNDKVICVIWSTGYYSALIMDDMRDEHFEKIYGIPITADTTTLEEQYEKEYAWDFLEVEMLSNNDAERRCIAIMERKTDGT